jgi:hypothetical protein
LEADDGDLLVTGLGQPVHQAVERFRGAIKRLALQVASTEQKKHKYG